MQAAYSFVVPLAVVQGSVVSEHGRGSSTSSGTCPLNSLQLSRSSFFATCSTATNQLSRRLRRYAPDRIFSISTRLRFEVPKSDAFLPSSIRSELGEEESHPEVAAGAEGQSVECDSPAPVLANEELRRAFVAAAAAGFSALSVAAPALADVLAAIDDPGNNAWVPVAIFLLRPVLSIWSFLFVVRIILSWYPAVDIAKFPWALVIVPTEPFLKPTRSALPPIGGVDISPIVWVAIFSFLNEILIGPQGILTILSRSL